MRFRRTSTRHGGAAAGVAHQVDERVEELLAHGELDASIAWLRGQSSISPDQLRYLAWLEQRRGDYFASVGTLNRLLADDPNDAESLLLKAYAEWFEGDLGRATVSMRLVCDAPQVSPAIAERARSNLERVESQAREMMPIVVALRRLDGACAVATIVTALLVLACTATAIRRA